MQGCSKKNKLEQEITPTENNFAIKGTSLKDHIGRVGRHIKTIFSRMIYHSITVLVCTKLNINACVSGVLAMVTEISAKVRGLAGSWLR